MCQVIMWVHAKCDHPKKFEAIPGGRCSHYEGQEGGLCSDETVAVHTNKIIAPSLCVTCFRKVEDEIEAEADQKAIPIVRELGRLELSLERLSDAQTRKSIIQDREELLDELRDYKLECKFAIANFRSIQGVWADG